eukprot:TRINITY_DN12420_c0_g1_i3.p1 TRINITY_DN12420_c0_g1~~TRINITY_DN12420_c0_g1_i3.p1  ORF type:complete len:331 (-),score=55.28 TRINITY_DN12420_c0_g1_i3:56-1048(-)
MVGNEPRHLLVLPFKLKLASLPRNQLPSCTHALLKILLFPTSKNRFFSVADTDSEVSLVLEESCLSLFGEEASSLLQHSDQTWRAIKYDEGELGFEATGIVSSITQPLAKAKVPIYYLSTYTTDYFLVEDIELSKTIDVLSGSGFKFSEAAQDEGHDAKPMPPTPVAMIAQSPPHNNRPEGGAKSQLLITKLPYQLYMSRLRRENFEKVACDLIRMIFYSTIEKRFFSLTETPDEISLIFDHDCVSVLEGAGVSLETCKMSWRALQICEGANWSNESGLLSKFSQPLAEASISIFNFSTYHTDYTLVEDHNLDLSLDKLSDKLEIVLDEE